MRESVLKKIFFPTDKSIKYRKWIKLTILEIYLGEQLIEMLLAFSSYTRDHQGEVVCGTTSYGYQTADIEDFIAATLINKWLCKHIKELLEIKYLNNYNILRLYPATDKKELEYEVNPEKVFRLTELKLSYNTIWVSLNLTLDILVFIFSGSLVAALTTGAFVEFIRRFKF